MNRTLLTLRESEKGVDDQVSVPHLWGMRAVDEGLIAPAAEPEIGADRRGVEEDVEGDD